MTALSPCSEDRRPPRNRSRPGRGSPTGRGPRRPTCSPRDRLVQFVGIPGRRLRDRVRRVARRPARRGGVERHRGPARGARRRRASVPGDEVIVPSHTFVATPLAVLHAGARPVFADVHRRPDARPPGRSTRSPPTAPGPSIVVHLYGVVCDMGRILERARARGIAVVEDCAQALGGEWQGRRAGTLADAGCFSFSQVKHLTTAGEGGMVVSADAASSRARVHSPTSAGSADGDAAVLPHVRTGWNYHLSEVQAAVGLAELERLELLEPRATPGVREVVRPRVFAASGREGRAAEHRGAPQRVLDLPAAARARAPHVRPRGRARGDRGGGHSAATDDETRKLRGAGVRGRRVRALPESPGSCVRARCACTCTPRGSAVTSTWS